VLVNPCIRLMSAEKSGRIAAERALFHAEPRHAVGQLRIVYAAAPGDPRTRWLLAVALGALGQYADAAALLDPWLRTDPLAATARASHLRQLEHHREAEALDRHALTLPAGPDARADALIGLVADAVGQGYLDQARERLDAATAALAGVAGIPNAIDPLPTALVLPHLATPAPPVGRPPPTQGAGWRGGIRLAWVAAEVALLGGRPAQALRHAAEAVRRSEEAAAPRHLTKSLLFRGVAEEVAGDPAAADTLASAAAGAERMGLLPLVWPARLVRSRLLAATDPDGAGAEAARAAEVRETLANWLRGAPPHGAAFNFSHPNG
jgi:tetratricopeptide (TPR) repeat protein